MTVGFLGRRNTKKCFVNGCEERIPARWLMCTAHWDMVPTEAQFEVYSTLRTWQQGGDPHAYIAAIKRAAAAVADKVARRDERKAPSETEETHSTDRLERESNFRSEIFVGDARIRRLLRDMRRSGPHGR